jgi:hypothetical protein
MDVLRKSKEETSKEVLNMKLEGNCPIGKEIKMRKTGYERCQAEGRAWEDTEEEFWEERDRQRHLVVRQPT